LDGSNRFAFHTVDQMNDFAHVDLDTDRGQATYSFRGGPHEALSEVSDIKLFILRPSLCADFFPRH